MKTKLLVGTIAVLAVFSWLSGIAPMAPESPATLRPSSKRSERQSATGLETSDPLAAHGAPGRSPTQAYSSKRSGLVARDTSSTDEQQQDHASGFFQKNQNSPHRTDKEEISFGPSVRQTHTGYSASQLTSINGRKSLAQIPHSSMPMTPHAPASWVQIPDSPHLTTHQQEEIQQMAEALLTTIDAADQQGATPEAMNAIRNAAIRSSDAEFRRKFGQHAWLEHHIQAYHLGLAR